jgi:hypothetical protein
VLFPALLFCTLLCGVPANTTHVATAEEPLIYTDSVRHIHNILYRKLEDNINMNEKGTGYGSVK